MSAYIEKILNHSVHDNLSIVQSLLQEVELLPDKPPADVEALARISQVIKNFASSLDTCDKNLISISWLEDASKALANAKSYLTNYKSTRDPNQLITHTFNQLDSLLVCSTKLNCVKSKQSLRGLIESVTEYTRVMESHSEQAQEKASQLSKDVDALKTLITNNEKTSQSSLETLQRLINTEQQRLDGFSTSYQNQMTADQKAFSEMIDTLKSSFALTQEDRKKTFDAEVDLVKAQEKSIQENADSQATMFKLSYEQLIEEYRKKFDEHEKQVSNIVGIVNTNMFSHKYKKVADDSHKSAKRWHILAVLLMIAVGAFAVYAFVITVNTDTSWVKLVAKIFATTTLVTSAAYAARQASKQEKVERYARKIEMELVAIDPFIESLDEERRAVIKEDLAKKLFGNADAMGISSKDEAYPAIDKIASIEESLKTILSLITSLAK